MGRLKFSDRSGDICFFVLFAVITVVMVIRAFFGIEITDEAYYIAEVRTVLDGNLPYAYNNSDLVGMTVVMVPFVWIYRLFVSGDEGLFLYMRLCYVIFRAVVLLVGYLLLKKKTGKFAAACACLIMAAYHMNILNFSYNTISTLFVFITGILLYYLEDMKEGKARSVLYFVAGVLSALTVLSHPVHALSIVLFIILLFVYKTPFKDILFYVLGGIAQLLVLFVPIMIQSSPSVLLKGLIGFCGNFGGEGGHDTEDVISIMWENFMYVWIAMAAVFLVLAVVFFIVSKPRSKAVVLPALYVAVVGGIIYTMFFRRSYYSMALIGSCAAFVLIVLLIAYPKEKTVWYIGFPAVFFSVFEAFVTVTGSPMLRFMHAVPALCVLFVIGLRPEGDGSGSGCGSGFDAGSDSNSGSDADSSFSSGSDSGSSSGSSAGSDFDSGSDTDSSPDCGFGSDADSSFSSGPVSDSSSGFSASSDFDSGSDTDSNSDCGSGSGSGSGSDSNFGSRRGKWVKVAVRYVLPVLALVAIIAGEMFALTYVYRDETLDKLTCKVPDGIYKGIYTTQKNIDDMNEFRKYIRKHIKPGDVIAFRDNVPVGYLIADGTMCDISTWDSLQFNLGYNDPTALYEYYDRVGRMPDKIIYVLYGFYENMSFMDNNFLYNEFIAENYEYTHGQTDYNDTYRIIMIFERK